MEQINAVSMGAFEKFSILNQNPLPPADPNVSGVKKCQNCQQEEDDCECSDKGALHFQFVNQDEDLAAVDTSLDRKKSLARRGGGPVVQANAAKTIHEIITQQTRMRLDSGKKSASNAASNNQSENMNESSDQLPADVPEKKVELDANIYRQSEQMLTTFYSNLPQGGVFNLSEKELRIINKLKQ